MKDEALRLALEVLEYQDHLRGEAIAAIKQALEQSVADSNTSKEPVAKIEKTQHEPFAWYVDFGNDDEPNYFSKTKPDELRALVIPLYTAPPKRKPLTDEHHETFLTTFTDELIDMSDEDVLEGSDPDAVLAHCQTLLERAKKKVSPTAGMNLAQRILHVGGRNNAAGYVEFGSVQAVDALIQHVLRDLPTQPPKREPLTDEEIYELWEDHVVPVFGNPVVFARVIEAAHGIKGEA